MNHVTCAIFTAPNSLTVIAEIHSVFAAQWGGPADYRCSPARGPGLAGEGPLNTSSSPAGEPRTCPGLLGRPGEPTGGGLRVFRCRAYGQPVSRLQYPVKRRSKAGHDLVCVRILRTEVLNDHRGGGPSPTGARMSIGRVRACLRFAAGGTAPLTAPVQASRCPSRPADEA